MLVYGKLNRFKYSGIIVRHYRFKIGVLAIIMVLKSAKHTLVFCVYSAPSQRDATMLHQCSFLVRGTVHHTTPILPGGYLKITDMSHSFYEILNP